MGNIPPKIENLPSAVHIRRGDKIQEALFHDIERYMKLVEDHILINSKRNHQDSNPELYVSTDDPSAVMEMKASFGGKFKLLGANSTKATNAASVLKRFLPQIHDELIHDFYGMVNSKFLVCTFSSNFCRLAYEYKLATQYLIDIYQVIEIWRLFAFLFLNVQCLTIAI